MLTILHLARVSQSGFAALLAERLCLSVGIIKVLEAFASAQAQPQNRRVFFGKAEPFRTGGGEAAGSLLLRGAE
jgi:hypothetical protein